MLLPGWSWRSGRYERVFNGSARQNDVGMLTAHRETVSRNDGERLALALENAVSVASVLLLTEATLTDIPEPKAEANPMMGEE